VLGGGSAQVGKGGGTAASATVEDVRGSSLRPG